MDWALQARNSARVLTAERERLVTNMIRKMMKAEKLSELSATCLASLRSLDGTGGGLLRVAEFNEALRGLTEEERQVGRWAGSTTAMCLALNVLSILHQHISPYHPLTHPMDHPLYPL